MKVSSNHGRLGITPVLATLILIAITLVAGVALAGLVFGLFGTLSNSPAVSVIISNVHAQAAGTMPPTLPTLMSSCSSTLPAGGSWLEFRNSGTGTGSLVAMNFFYGGIALTTTISNCAMSPGATVWIGLTFTGPVPASNGGDIFSGQAILANGAQVPFYSQFK